MFVIGSAIVFGTLVRLVDRKDIKWLAFGWLIVMSLFSTVLSTFSLEVFFTILIRSILVYFWGLLLYHFEDTIILYLGILLGGTLLIYYF